MAGLSNALEQSVLEWLFKSTVFPGVPTQLWFSLHSADPSDTGASELATTGSYGRAQLNPDANNSTNTNYNAVATVGTATRTTNKGDISFPQASANWNSSAAIQFWGCWSAQTVGTGTFYIGGSIGGGGVVVLSGNTLKFAGGSPGSFNFDVD